MKFNYKTNNLVAYIATRFFLDEDKLNQLVGKTMFLVPPEFDIQREITVKGVKIINMDKSLVEIFSNIDNCESTDMFRNKTLLINKTDIYEIYGEEILKTYLSDHINKEVYDSNLGYIGKIISVDGTDAQKHLVVECKNGSIMIPFVEEIVYDITDEKVFVNVPDGLLELNR